MAYHSACLSGERTFLGESGQEEEIGAHSHQQEALVGAALGGQKGALGLGH